MGLQTVRKKNQFLLRALVVTISLLVILGCILLSSPTNSQSKSPVTSTSSSDVVKKSFNPNVPSSSTPLFDPDVPSSNTPMAISSSSGSDSNQLEAQLEELEHSESIAMEKLRDARSKVLDLEVAMGLKPASEAIAHHRMYAGFVAPKPARTQAAPGESALELVGRLMRDKKVTEGRLDGVLGKLRVTRERISDLQVRLEIKEELRSRKGGGHRHSSSPSSPLKDSATKATQKSQSTHLELGHGSSTSTSVAGLQLAHETGIDANDHEVEQTEVEEQHDESVFMDQDASTHGDRGDESKYDDDHEAQQTEIEEQHDENLFLDQEATTHGGRGDESKDGEGDELTRLKKRNFEEYSEGHRRMYAVALTLFGGKDVIRRANILEVGVGIGWGLGKMTKVVDLKSYVGVEPCKSCVNYVKKNVVQKWVQQRKSEIARLSKAKQASALAELPTFELFPETFLDVPQETLADAFHGDRQADFSICIEVVEHVAPAERLAFFKQMKALTKHSLFLSTPNKATHPQHGALTSEQWRDIIMRAGFTSVTVLEWQWTTLFICSAEDESQLALPDLSGDNVFLDQEATTHGGRGDESKDGEGDEYTRLKKRHFTDYSEGHRRMYNAGMHLIGGYDTIRPAQILEVGVGIGWGLGKMTQVVNLKSYVGVEPCQGCVDHVRKQVIGSWIAKRRKEIQRMSIKKQESALAEIPSFELFPKTFLDVPLDTLADAFHGDRQADFSFCIEVVEHVAPAERLDFFKQMKALTKHAFFLSTPNKATHPQHGALTNEQWRAILLRAGFTTVSVIEWQWTTMFICT